MKIECESVSVCVCVFTLILTTSGFSVLKYMQISQTFNPNFNICLDQFI